MPKLSDFDRDLIENILERIQEAHIQAGGRFFYRRELRNITIGEFLDLVTPNNIEVTVKYNPMLGVMRAKDEHG